MSIIAIIFPAMIMVTMEDMLRAGFSKANEIITHAIYKRKVRERRSRSQRRWA